MLAHPDAVVNALAPEPGMKVADFGAGSAMHLPALSAAVGTGGRVYLVDVQKDLLARARSRAAEQGIRNADFIWADLELPKSTRLEDASLDRVLVSHLLFQLDASAPVFAEAFRVLKPGAKLLVVEWSTPPSAAHGGTLVPKAEAASLAVAAGFSQPREVEVGFGQYALLAEKPR